MPLATFLAVAVARDADADPDAAAVARTVPGFDDADAHDDLYACQLAPVWKSNLQPDFNNFMCVLSGRKTVELWPPGERALCASAPAWEHHARAAPPPPAAVFDVGAGDAAFWPEGWWHRVTSAPRTRAINVWWRGATRRRSAPLASSRCGRSRTAARRRT
ncbi:hypothetical protein JL722_13073 [Aureococcus anophagefferens]|nr:hypothetical protein JL722_13073 [Aureococcus anophagefferens]